MRGVARYESDILLVFGLGVAVRMEFGQRGHHGTSIPDGVSLLRVRDYVDLDTARLLENARNRQQVSPTQGDSRTHLHVATRGRLGAGDARVDNVLEVALEPLREVTEHGRPSGQHDVLRGP